MQSLNFFNTKNTLKNSTYKKKYFIRFKIIVVLDHFKLIKKN